MFDDIDVDFDCPDCSHKITKTIGWLTAHKEMSCPGCGVTINLETDDLASSMKKLNQAIDSIPKDITIKF